MVNFIDYGRIPLYFAGFSHLNKCLITDHMSICKDTVPADDHAGPLPGPLSMHLPWLMVVVLIVYGIDFNNDIFYPGTNLSRRKEQASLQQKNTKEWQQVMGEGFQLNNLFH